MNDKVTTDTGQWLWTNVTMEPPASLLASGESWVWVHGATGPHWEIR